MKPTLGVALVLVLVVVCGCRDNPQQAKLREYAATDYLEGGLDEPTRAARPKFKKLIRDLMMLKPGGALDSKLAPLETCVLELNQIHSIETVERDIFMGAVEDIGAIVGLDAPSFDHLQKLRDF